MLQIILSVITLLANAFIVIMLMLIIRKTRQLYRVQDERYDLQRERVDTLSRLCTKQEGSIANLMTTLDAHHQRMDVLSGQVERLHQRLLVTERGK